jgi:hypothetical protein
MMAIKIIDSKGFHRYMDAIEDIDCKIEELEQKITTLREYLKDLYAKKEECVIHYLDTPTYSHSMELIDKFIKDINFNGYWSDKWYYERYFYLDDIHGWNIGDFSNDKVVYYREVEMRYQDLKREGKL